MKPHKHSEVIKAWADGNVIQAKSVLSDTLGEWFDVIGNDPLWTESTEYRVKPEPPAKVYPVTGMSSSDLYHIWTQPAVPIGALTNVANAALRHAIDAGQVIVPDGTVWTDFKWGDEARAARDMAVAEAVRDAIYATNNPCSTIEELAAIIAKVKL